NQADFAMSKIAADEKYNGNILRKAIDYFCRLAVDPLFYRQLKSTDKEFVQTDYFQEMSWLKDEIDDTYDPSYADMLRVAFTYKFKRGRLQHLVALLSGRNFETEEYEERIAEESFKKLDEGVREFINETNFKRFVMIIRSAGFINSSLISSQNTLNFSYVLYLLMRELNMNQAEIESLVRKWFVFSLITNRYSGPTESTFDYDVKRIYEEGARKYIDDTITAEMSEGFWEQTLPRQMNKSNINNPVFHVFLAAQVKNNDKGFLSRDVTVKDLIELRGDVHHIFPKEYLKKLGYNSGDYNQIANYVMTQTEINIAIGSKPPSIYLNELLEQCRTGTLKYGGIKSEEELIENLETHCIPEEIFNTDGENYKGFLEKRRKLMALKIRDYFAKL
ncbi:MAG TPA: hypothetical protein PKV93_14615, partial [Fervidobacterium sp.]|nr:hypothetical protein [Fervidobacterium sp.]